jgi:hypothetical protein
LALSGLQGKERHGCDAFHPEMGQSLVYSSIIESSSRYRNIYFQHHFKGATWDDGFTHVLDIYHPYGCHLNGGGREGGRGREIVKLENDEIVMSCL